MKRETPATSRIVKRVALHLWREYPERTIAAVVVIVVLVFVGPQRLKEIGSKIAESYAGSGTNVTSTGQSESGGDKPETSSKNGNQARPSETPAAKQSSVSAPGIPTPDPELRIILGNSEHNPKRNGGTYIDVVDEAKSGPAVKPAEQSADPMPLPTALPMKNSARTSAGSQEPAPTPRPTLPPRNAGQSTENQRPAGAEPRPTLPPRRTPTPSP